MELEDLKMFLCIIDCMSPVVRGIDLAAGSEVATAKKQITLLLIRLFKMVSYICLNPYQYYRTNPL